MKTFSVGFLKFLIMYALCFVLMKAVLSWADLFESGLFTWEFIKNFGRVAWNALVRFRRLFSENGKIGVLFQGLIGSIDKFWDLLTGGFFEWFSGLFA